MKHLKNATIVVAAPLLSTYAVLWMMGLLFNGGDWLAEKLTGAM